MTENRKHATQYAEPRYKDCEKRLSEHGTAPRVVIALSAYRYDAPQVQFTSAARAWRSRHRDTARAWWSRSFEPHFEHFMRLPTSGTGVSAGNGTVAGFTSRSWQHSRQIGPQQLVIVA